PPNDAISHLFTQPRKSGHYQEGAVREEISRTGWGDRMTSRAAGRSRRFLIAIARWFDTSAGGAPAEDLTQKTDWFRCVPYVAVHLMCLGVIWVGWSPVAAGVAVALYFIRMFAITGFYHRYFSHRSFKTSRAGQFVFAVIGATAVQRGVLWWASHHRLHHQRSDEPEDVHSPR